MGLKDLFIALADVFDGPEAIEGHAKQALLSADYGTRHAFEPTELTELTELTECVPCVPYYVRHTSSNIVL